MPEILGAGGGSSGTLTLRSPPLRALRLLLAQFKNPLVQLLVPSSPELSPDLLPFAK